MGGRKTRSAWLEELQMGSRGCEGREAALTALPAPFQLSSPVLPGSTRHFLDVVCPEGNLNSCEVSTDEQCSFR